MGPYASLKFYEKILNLTNAKKDWEHIHTIIDSNTSIPSRTRNYIYNENSPVPGMVKSIKKLNEYPVDIIAIPCNSACYFLDVINDDEKNNVINIIEITSNELTNKLKKGKKVAVFGGYITFHAQTYKKYLKEYEYILHNEEEQEKISYFIEKIKLNEDIKDEFTEFTSQYIKKYEIDALILGCTEFSYVKTDFDILVIDSNEELAKYCVNYCVGTD